MRSKLVVVQQRRAKTPSNNDVYFVLGGVGSPANNLRQTEVAKYESLASSFIVITLYSGQSIRIPMLARSNTVPKTRCPTTTV